MELELSKAIFEPAEDEKQRSTQQGVRKEGIDAKSYDWIVAVLGEDMELKGEMLKEEREIWM